jgi:hypothetical protein
MKHTYGKVVSILAVAMTAFQYFYGKDWQYWAFITICFFMALIVVIEEEK